VQASLQLLTVKRNEWTQFNDVDTLIHANAIFETIDSIKRNLQEYDCLSAQRMYPEIIPPRNLPYLPSVMRKVENDVALRTKATELRGQHAIFFMDLLVEVCSMLKIQVLESNSPVFQGS
jgi:hypothetical protein